VGLTPRIAANPTSYQSAGARGEAGDNMLTLSILDFASFSFREGGRSRQIVAFLLQLATGFAREGSK